MNPTLSCGEDLKRPDVCAILYLNRQPLDLVLQSSNGTRQVAALVRVDGSRDYRAAHSAGSAKSHLRWHVDVRHIFVLLDVRKQLGYRHSHGEHTSANRGRCRIIASGDASAANSVNLARLLTVT